jgi:hypothetical protein
MAAHLEKLQRSTIRRNTTEEQIMYELAMLAMLGVFAFCATLSVLSVLD